MHFNYFTHEFIMIKAILFDLDNTLIDFMTMKEAASKEAVKSMVDAGLKLDVDKALKKLFSFYEKHGIEDQTVFDKFVKEVQGEQDYRILSEGIIAYRKIKAGYVNPYPHAVSTLIKLKEMGLVLGIISDAPRKQAWLRLAESRLTFFFDFVIALEDTGKRKPHLMPFEKGLQKLNMKAGEILFVGDNPARDIKGAKNIGMKTALAKYGQVFPDKDVKADYELNDLNDLVKVVEKENK